VAALKNVDLPEFGFPARAIEIITLFSQVKDLIFILEQGYTKNLTAA